MSMLLVHELHEARDRILLLKRRLLEAKSKDISLYQGFIDGAINSLNASLEQANIPERYRVAVVGQFKVGKSDFVNKLIGEQLAGVHGNPETAAISIFRYDDTARAEVEFVSSEEWDKLKSDYDAEPQNQELKRYASFINYNKQSTGKDKENDNNIQLIDLQKLTERWIMPGGYIHKIEATEWKTKEGKKEFIKKIKQFTSSKEPLHYLVNKLIIYAPIPILQDSIELIDTPGLNDTERYRVRLTEELVKDVDAILFLTTSGASYSQLDKDFIVHQLRRQKIKHLQLVITKGDMTFAGAVKDARENDEAPPTYESFRAREIKRVESEVRKTLDELLSSNEILDDDKYYFIEQLDNIPIHLTSTEYHADGDISRGGIEAVKDGIYHILSTSQRVKSARFILSERLDATLNKLRNSYRERLEAIENDYDSQKVKGEIKAIQLAVEEELNFLSRNSEEFVDILKKKQSIFQNSLSVHLENIDLKAREVLIDIEKIDLCKHWKTRRVGRWGYLIDLQTKVADRIFPKVEILLNELRDQANEFMGQIENCLDGLQHKISNIEEEHRISSLEPLKLADSQQPFFKSFEKTLNTFTTDQRDGIISQLDQFVDEEISQRLDQSRASVSDILGSGTTWRQNDEVTRFYREIRMLLGKALQKHLSVRIEEFKNAIINNAETVIPYLKKSSKDVIEQRLQAIESAFEIEATGEKERIKLYIRSMILMLRDFAAESQLNVSTKVSSGSNSYSNNLEICKCNDDIFELNNKQTWQSRSYEIQDNDTGYTYERIFRPYIDTAEEIIIEDPYIRKPYQVSNLARFCALALRVGAVKRIILKSGYTPGEDLSDADSRLEKLMQNLQFRDIEFSYSRDQNIHDREIYFSNGWTVNIGRGLDIYYPPESRGGAIDADDYSLRRCRWTKINIFLRSTVGS